LGSDTAKVGLGLEIEEAFFEFGAVLDADGVGAFVGL
jgi:hypothetical protein